MASTKDYNIPSHGDKLKKKMQDAPFVPIGVAGMIGTVIYGAISYKKAMKTGMKTSVFLMHLRVKAQGMVVGAMAIGVGYTLLRDYVFNKPIDSSVSK